MKTTSILGNIIWIIFGGLELAIGYCLGGLLLCCTIIGIPFGLQIFKLGIYAFLPFGYTTEYSPNGGGCLATLMNILWIFTFGIILSIIHFIFGLFFCVTIIGIPLGVAHFKLIRVAFAPFGLQIVNA